jgi:hypothetical protein
MQGQQLHQRRSQIAAKSFPNQKEAKPVANFYSVHQLTGHMHEGSPASQQAAMSMLDNLSSSSDNLSNFHRDVTGCGIEIDSGQKAPSKMHLSPL